jgi:hypothetical protein
MRTHCFLGRTIAMAFATVLLGPGFPLPAIAAPPGPGIDPRAVALRIQFGLKDTDGTDWSGSLGVSPGRVAKAEIWRKGRQDTIEGNAWKLSTRSAPRFQGAAQKGKPIPIAENGLLLTLSETTEQSEIAVHTKQGDFTFKLADVPLGTRLMRLEGAVDVVRTPASYQVTADATEEDYPSAAVASDGTVWIAYMAFTHGKDFAKRRSFDEEPRDLSNLNEPTGGDRILVKRYRDGQWSEPLPVTPGGEDLYKTAIAVDGQGRPWVFWSAQREGNFDLYASSWNGSGWTPALRLTRDPGSDLSPAAATDAQGRVWVTWQAFRGDNSQILALRQEGDRFTGEITIAAAAGNAWDPAIATSRSGDVAIAWDTYANGSYDVYLRVAKGGGEFAPAVPVAASAKEEVHAALAYDGTGRLWVAWEQGPELWGKDFGATVKDKGAPLYGGGPRTVAVKCFAGEQPFETKTSLASALQPQTGPKGGSKAGAKAGANAGAKQKEGPKTSLPRKPGQENLGQGGVPKSYPRLVADKAGRIWLAYRARSPHFWCPVGTSWFEYVTCCEGERWLSPIYVHHTDNILDNRPALVALADGQVLLVNSADGRQTVSGYPQALQQEKPQADKGETVNNDIYASLFGLPNPPVAPRLVAAAVEKPVEPLGAAEREAVSRCRSYRLEIGNKSLRLMRGEFHRHTELSTDGGGDGALSDMYRYALDAVRMDWIGCGDHDNNNGREYPWWITQKTADAYQVGTSFIPMYSYERSVSYPDGHRNVIFARRGVRTLPRLGKPGTGRDDQQPAHTPDTLLLYRYLEQFGGLCASHTSATDMGTDWRDNNPRVEPMVEVFQGCRQNYEEPDAPRAPTADDAIGGWRPNGFVWRALAKGYRLGFQASSDHVSTHISFCNLWVEEPSREALLRAMKQRHVFGATDNLIADVRCGDHMMGDEFTLATAPRLTVKLIGTGPLKRVDIVKDNRYVYQTTPGKREVEFTWIDKSPTPGTSYYYVRGEQDDGELVWASPMWITYKP